MNEGRTERETKLMSAELQVVNTEEQNFGELSVSRMNVFAFFSMSFNILLELK